MNSTPLDDNRDDAARQDARQHARNARREWQESINAFFPPEFVTHQRRARREMLLAWRSMLDRAIQRIDERVNKTDTDLDSDL
jgi:hypothetical protein